MQSQYTAQMHCEQAVLELQVKMFALAANQATRSAGSALFARGVEYYTAPLSPLSSSSPIPTGLCLTRLAARQVDRERDPLTRRRSIQ